MTITLFVFFALPLAALLGLLLLAALLPALPALLALSALSGLPALLAGLTALLTLLSTLTVLLHVVCHENTPLLQFTPEQRACILFWLLKVSCGKSWRGWDRSSQDYPNRLQNRPLHKTFNRTVIYLIVPVDRRRAQGS